MSPPNSSISSSEVAPPQQRRRGLLLAGWTILFLVLLDIAVNLAFAYPDDPKNVNPGRTRLYFDYGRSMEGRLRRETRVDPAATAPITLAGWYDPLVAASRPAKPSGRMITIYGNSNSVRLADALQRSSRMFSARSVAGPGAPANWAYGAFLRDKDKTKGQAVVLTIMPSNLAMIRTMSAMTWNQSFAMPYTSDVFSVRNGKLIRQRPPYENFWGYTDALYNEPKWQGVLEQFAAHDPFFDPLLFRQTFLDNSTLVRLLRRGWAQHRDLDVRAHSLSRAGFNPSDDAVRIANLIVAEFAANARAEGLVPVIYIVNNLGYGDQMYQALQFTLDQQGIPTLSSHTLIDPNDPRNYLPDTHFTEANDLRMAQALDQLVQTELAKQAERNQGRGLAR